MPKFLEEDLRKEAAKKGFSGKRADRYVYGAMNNMGAMHGNKETAKGAHMEAKHERDMSHLKSEVEVHEYDHKRPKRQVRSRYSK